MYSRRFKNFPLCVVKDFDLMDDGDPTPPPMFSCEKCGGEMYPEYNKVVHRVKKSDICKTKKNRAIFARFFLLLEFSRSFTVDGFN
jgi:hypothetical protein